MFLRLSPKEGRFQALKRELYLVTLPVQLRNGSKIGEIIGFIHNVAQEYKREALITLEKRKNNYQKLVVLSKEITKTDILIVKGLLEDELKASGKKDLVVKISTWVRKT